MLLLRKCDWDDPEGVRLALEYGADPNLITVWGLGAILLAPAPIPIFPDDAMTLEISPIFDSDTGIKVQSNVD
jgi:hypothetical protein